MGSRSRGIIPWLWAVNGTMSVVGSSLATILSLAWGFHSVTLVGIAGYALAWLLVWQMGSRALPVPALQR